MLFRGVGRNVWTTVDRNYGRVAATRNIPPGLCRLSAKDSRMRLVRPAHPQFVPSWRERCPIQISCSCWWQPISGNLIALEVKSISWSSEAITVMLLRWIMGLFQIPAWFHGFKILIHWTNRCAPTNIPQLFLPEQWCLAWDKFQVIEPTWKRSSHDCLGSQTCSVIKGILKVTFREQLLE